MSLKSPILAHLRPIFLQTAQHHVQRSIISGISDQCYMFRLMTFEVLKLVNQFGLYLFLSIMKEIPSLLCGGIPESKRCKSVWSISFSLDHEGNPLPPLWRDS